MSEMGYAMMGTGVASGEDRAEEAADIAISSPLLEDIDLSGARGVLVNITAGFDMRLDEFETVGNTIRSFASDNATVVIGTSLDPEMKDALRVTVVATGIGIENRSDINIIKNKSNRDALTDYRYPNFNRNHINNKKINIKDTFGSTIKKTKKSNYLDIPTFLRKQSD
ncbi:MAG TPA: cell division protein FtsZ, partial [Buchnera sp. (in: enterobacteria)]|nr:cell division protein FtsZ [Buchnera sp. (in: enterobacteria)]